MNDNHSVHWEVAAYDVMIAEGTATSVAEGFRAGFAILTDGVLSLSPQGALLIRVADEDVWLVPGDSFPYPEGNIAESRVMLDGIRAELLAAYE